VFEVSGYPATGYKVNADLSDNKEGDILISCITCYFMLLLLPGLVLMKRPPAA